MLQARTAVAFAGRIANDRSMPDSRVDLESKVAMLERTVDALSAELAAQQRVLDILQTHVELLRQHLKRPPADDAIEPHDTRPPHWGG